MRSVAALRTKISQGCELFGLRLHRRVQPDIVFSAYAQPPRLFRGHWVMNGEHVAPFEVQEQLALIACCMACQQFKNMQIPVVAA